MGPLTPALSPEGRGGLNRRGRGRGRPRWYDPAPVPLSRLPLADLRRRLLTEGAPLSAADEAALRGDPRAGARAVLAAVERRRAANQREGQRLSRLLAFERPLWAAGLTRVAGVDEAGVGPLAGPLVAAAVILPPSLRPRGLDDSKKLDEPSRDRLAAEVKAGAVAWAVGQASPEEIDRLNPYQAGLLAMRRAVEGLAVAPEHLLVDARRVPGQLAPQQPIVKGDARSLSIAAASVVAKTTRDALMVEAEARWPGYGFARHKGYGAPEHLEALRRLGACPIHRRSYAPVAEVLGLRPSQGDLFRG
ncbi:MAG: ribonuclease HII [Anaeromyxobacter sp.]|nr:ribonuclease HII [Anaeromyxobacter sp.]MBL0275324.1 ribonuclease HII [Anaeromyxobacter sp.]